MTLMPSRVSLINQQLYNTKLFFVLHGQFNTATVVVAVPTIFILNIRLISQSKTLYRQLLGDKNYRYKKKKFASKVKMF